MYWIIAIIVLLVLGAVGLKLYRRYTGGTNVSREQLQQWMDKEMDVYILDVRSKKEYESSHIPDAINIGLRDISARMDELKPYNNHKIVVYCEIGGRAGIAQKILNKAGFSEVYHLTGDMAGWRKAGFPTEPKDGE